LQQQSALTQAESNLVNANSNYVKARVELDRSIGATLDRLGILMNDAEKGIVSKMPLVPYVRPRPPEEQTPELPPPGSQQPLQQAPPQQQQPPAQQPPQ
jgi:hypothetical protein